MSPLYNGGIPPPAQANGDIPPAAQPVAAQANGDIPPAAQPVAAQANGDIPLAAQPNKGILAVFQGPHVFNFIAAVVDDIILEGLEDDGFLGLIPIAINSSFGEIYQQITDRYDMINRFGNAFAIVLHSPNREDTLLQEHQADIGGYEWVQFFQEGQTININLIPQH